MVERHYSLKPLLLAIIVVIAVLLALIRLVLCIIAALAGQPDGVLAFPLAVIMPVTVLLFLVLQPATRTSEGSLMRLAALLLILLVLAIPRFALHLALGFPVAFLTVELFETRLPAPIRDTIKRSVMT